MEPAQNAVDDETANAKGSDGGVNANIKAKRKSIEQARLNGRQKVIHKCSKCMNLLVSYRII
jgi:hypothetical protein